MANTVPGDTHAIGDAGHTTDHNNIADMLTLMGAVNVKNTAYGGGAAGTGGNDTTPFADAFAAAQSSGRPVVIPAGNYQFNEPIPCGGGSPGALKIIGEGWNTQLKLMNGANCYLFDTGASGSPQFTPGLVMRDLYINCNGGNQTGFSGGVYARGAVFSRFDHCWFDQPYDAGVHCYQDGLGNYGHHNRFFSCLFTNGYVSSSYGLGVKLDHADENSFHGCTFQDCGSSTYPSAQLYDTSAGLQSIIGCSFVTTRSTSVCMIKTDSSPSRLKIADCDFDSSTTGNHLELNGDGSSVTGCQFLNFGNSSNLAVHLSNDRCRIVGNSFYAAGSSGIAVSEDSGADYNIILGNSFEGTYSGSGPLVTHGAHTVAASNVTG